MNILLVHLRRHERIKEPSEAIKPWLGDDDTLRMAIGIINHDDSLECVLVRKCDDPNEADHGKHFGRVRFGLWRYDSDGRVFFMDGTVPDVETHERIVRCVRREVETCMRTLRCDSPPPRKKTMNTGTSVRERCYSCHYWNGRRVNESAWCDAWNEDNDGNGSCARWICRKANTKQEKDHEDV